MSELNTELINALLKNESLDEFFRAHLEEAINDLLKIELTGFLGYQKYSVEGYGTGNSRNGFYSRELDTKFGKLHLLIPRDRKGDFEQQLIPDYARRTDDLETTIITLYKKGIPHREISDLIEKMYGHYYPPTTVSNIAKAVSEQVKTFHSRQLSEKYVVIFMDATYLNVRRNSVAKEPLHVLLGITPDGTREILDYALYPTEFKENRPMKENINLNDYASRITDALPHGGVLLNTNGDKFNAMIIGWGALGTCWGVPTFTVYVREHRYTKAQLDKTGEFTISIPFEKPVGEIVRVCGSMSGNNVDKAAEAHLTLEDPETNSTPGVKEYPLTLECKVLYSQKQELSRLPEDIQKNMYPQDVNGSNPMANRDAHTMYIGQIVGAYIIR